MARQWEDPHGNVVNQKPLTRTLATAVDSATEVRAHLPSFYCPFASSPGPCDEVTALPRTVMPVVCGSVLGAYAESAGGRHPEGTAHLLPWRTWDKETSDNSKMLIMLRMSGKWRASTWSTPVLLVMRRGLSLAWHSSVPWRNLAALWSLSDRESALAYGAFSSDNYLRKHADCLCADKAV